jgi:hypothetical protein
MKKNVMCYVLVLVFTTYSTVHGMQFMLGNPKLTAYYYSYTAAPLQTATAQEQATPTQPTDGENSSGGQAAAIADLLPSVAVYPSPRDRAPANPVNDASSIHAAPETPAQPVDDKKSSSGQAGAENLRESVAAYPSRDDTADTFVVLPAPPPAAATTITPDEEAQRSHALAQPTPAEWIPSPLTKWLDAVTGDNKLHQSQLERWQTFEANQWPEPEDIKVSDYDSRGGRGQVREAMQSEQRQNESELERAFERHWYSELDHLISLGLHRLLALRHIILTR